MEQHLCRMLDGLEGQMRASVAAKRLLSNHCRSMLP